MNRGHLNPLRSQWTVAVGRSRSESVGRSNPFSSLLAPFITISTFANFFANRTSDWTFTEIRLR